MSTVCFAGKMQEFLKVREELYSLRNNGIVALPLFNIINQEKRAKEFKIKYQYLQKLMTTPNLSEREKKKMKQLLRFDKVTDFSQKNSGYGLSGDFYTTAYGIKVSTSCLKLLERVASVQGEYASYTNSRERVFSIFSKHLLEKGFEHVDEVLSRQIEMSVQKIFQCEHNYPQIKSFTQNWLKALKKTELHCEEPLSTESGYRGISMNDHYIWQSTKRMSLASDVFINFFINQDHTSESYSEPMETFIHELFHLSYSDNRAPFDHNHYSGEAFDDNCTAQDRITDRVYFLSALCTGKTYNITESSILDSDKDYYADELIVQKVKKCGMYDGCVKHFTDMNINKDKALKFCKNIVEMGKCRTSETGSRIEMPNKERGIFYKLVTSLFNEFRKCKDYHFQIRQSIQRPYGCSSLKYLAKPSNKILAELYEISQKSTLKDMAYSIWGLDRVKFLMAHPKTSRVLKTSEWNGLIKYIREKSYFGVAKTCKEKLEINTTVYKMEKPVLLKINECKLPK